MMTHVCELLGVGMQHSTEESDMKNEIDSRYAQRYGEYHPNPNGFYEVGRKSGSLLEAVVNIAMNPFTGMKMIIPVRSRIHLDLLGSLQSKIIYMVRDPMEVAESQKAFLKAESAVAQVEYLYVEAEQQFEKMGLDVLCMPYRDVLHDPAKAVSDVADFIDSPVPVDQAVASIKPTAIRFKREEVAEAQEVQQIG